MTIHLNFLEGASHAIAEALQIHDQQEKRSEDARNPYQIARAVDSLHLGVDKLLKYIVQRVDPYLLLKNPSRELLRNLRGAVLNGGATSIFTSTVRFETLDAGPIAEIIREVISPKIDTTEFAAFTDALQSIVRLRNAVQHGELFGEGEQILAAMRRMLGEVHPVASQLCPEFFSTLRTINGQAESRLKAYKAEIDGAWQVLIDTLRDHQSLDVPFTLVVRLPAAGEALIVSLRGERYRSDSFSSDLVVPIEDAKGFFRNPLPSGRSLGRALQRASFKEFHLDIVPTKNIQPGDVTRSLLELLAEGPPPPEPLLPLESGELILRSATGRASIHLPNIRKKSMLSIDLLLRNLTVQIDARQVQGSISGFVQSARSQPMADNTVVKADGSIQLEGESVSVDADEVYGLPAGTTRWSFGGVMQLSLRVASGDPPQGPLQ